MPCSCLMMKVIAVWAGKPLQLWSAAAGGSFFLRLSDRCWEHPFWNVQHAYWYLHSGSGSPVSGVLELFFFCIFIFNTAKHGRVTSSFLLSVIVSVPSTARIIWSWPTILSWTSQHDDIIALTRHNDFVVLWRDDSDSDQLRYTCGQSVALYNLTLSRRKRSSVADKRYRVAFCAAKLERMRCKSIFASH